jgi:hypothetical protein
MKDVSEETDVRPLPYLLDLVHREAIILYQSAGHGLVHPVNPIGNRLRRRTVIPRHFSL